MYYSIDKTDFLEKGQVCICMCPDWCFEKFQIATWNGVMFVWDDQESTMFHNSVTAFCPIDKNGFMKDLPNSYVEGNLVPFINELEAVRKGRGMSFLRLGMKVKHTHNGRFGVIMGGNSSQNLDILFDGFEHTQNCHPKWKMQYYNEDNELIAEYGD